MAEMKIYDSKIMNMNIFMNIFLNCLFMNENFFNNKKHVGCVFIF